MCSGDKEDELPLLWQKTSNKLLQCFNERFDKFEQSFQSLVSSQQVLTERFATTENQMADHEQRIQTMETSLTQLRQENERLQHKLSDLEGRSRRKNIKAVGIPEDEEKGRPTEFVSNLIPKLLGDNNFPRAAVINRDASGPHAIIARVHLAQEKEKILRLGRQRSMDY